MGKKASIRKLKKYFKRTFTKRNATLVGVFILAIIVLWAIMHPRNVIAPAAYSPLLEVIAKGESQGNYNAYFGNVANKEIDFTSMTVADVLAWQKRFVAEGNASSAVGRYQIIRPTLLGLVDERNLTTNEKFDQTLQDSLAITLMERRGSIDFIKNELSSEDFAHQLSKEWAALPKIIGDQPESSFYAGDGLNRSLIDSKTILGAVTNFKELAK